MKTLLLCLFFSATAFARGELILIGGGKRAPSILQKIIEVAKGNILIVPYASEIPDEVAASIKQELLNFGAVKVDVINCEKETSCLKQIKNTNLIFFTGGSQNRLLQRMQGTKALKLIRQRFQKDLSLAGTSAGTAIMSEVMLTGSPRAPYETIEGVRPNMVEVTSGFGFVRKMILDQHFIKRDRQNRLLSAVLDQPELVGVGIDEATAIHIDQDENFTVIGDSDVMIYDARKAQISVTHLNEYQVQDLVIKRLTPGSTFRH